MANQTLIFPDGQRINASLVVQYVANSVELAWIFAAGGTGSYTGYGTSLINYNNLLRIVDSVVAGGVDGLYDLAQLTGYTINSITPPIIHSNGTTGAITVTGTGFDSTMVGNNIWIEDLPGGYDGNSTSFTVSSIINPNQLIATWSSDGDGASINVTDFAYYKDSSGLLYGYFTGVSIVNP